MPEDGREESPTKDADERNEEEQGEEEEDELALPASGSHFKAEDKAEVMALLTDIRKKAESEDTCGLRFDRIRAILEKYQEQGQLLRPALPEITNELFESFWVAAQKQRDAVFTPFGGKSLDELLTPTTVHPEEQDDDPRTYIHEVCVLFYVLAKIVGPKNLVSRLPHDVKQFEFGLYFLIWASRTYHPRCWEVGYFLLLWLTNMILVPFDLASIDSRLHDSLDIADILIGVAKHFLRQPGKIREMGAFYIARMLSRPDMARSPRLPAYFEWCAVQLQHGGQFVRIGALSSIAQILKIGRRPELLPHLDLLSSVLTRLHVGSDMLLNKVLVKAVQRLGLAYLEPQVVTWRYDRGMRSLLDNLKSAGVAGAVEATSRPQHSAVPQSPASDASSEGAPEELEPVLDAIFQSLSNPHTIVRWSAAKGIGRITARLEKMEADDVVEAVLEKFELYEDSNAWHGGCLALAELARRGLLLPNMFGRVIPITLRALNYEVAKGSYNIGRHVRDAGCYVCWAFARAYAPADMQQNVQDLSSALLATACFDREVSVRRAAAAAFQECVGRLGNFPHGITIVTKADYFSLSNRRRAFLQIGPFIANLDRRYHLAFADHLANNRLGHWDISIRRLAAEALGILCGSPVEKDLTGGIVDTHLPSILDRCLSTGVADVRHGSILAVAEITRLAWDKLSSDVLTKVTLLLPKIEAARLYRGRGGEAVRLAVIRLIECIATAGVPLPDAVEVETAKGTTKKVRAQARYQESMDEHFKQASEDVQAAAAAAFEVYADRYYSAQFEEKFHSKIVSKQVANLSPGRLPNERRGAALLLGGMPYFEPLHCSIITALLKGTEIEETADERDAETRRNSCTALAKAACRAQSGMEEQVFSALQRCSCDYSIENRGDVGSFVRIAGIKALTTFTLRLSEWGMANSGHAVGVLQALLRQLSEKLDSCRTVAGEQLEKIVDDSSLMSCLSTADQEAVLQVTATPRPQWGMPSESFPRVAKLLARPAFFRAVLDGISVAAGGMSVHVSRPAFNALSDHIRTLTPEKCTELCEALCDILGENSCEDRVTHSLLGTTDKLLSLSLFSPAAAPKMSAAVRKEMSASRDIRTMLPSVDVLCGLLCIMEDSEAKISTLQCLLTLLAGRYPRVRAKTGQVLYTTLLALPEYSQADELLDILCSTVWDAANPEAIRSTRDRLYPLLGIPKPERAASPTKPSRPHPQTADELASYSALVRDAGY